MEEEASMAAEAEATRVAEERERQDNEKKEAKLQQEAQEAYGIIGDLDNALKAFQGALGLSDVSADRPAVVVSYFVQTNQLPQRIS